MKIRLFLAALLLSTGAFATTTITYQGQLTEGIGKFSGAIAMTFQLHETELGNDPIGPSISENVEVVDGLFQVELDFGAVFDGSPLYLEVHVDGTPLTPRQPITAAPMALYAPSTITHTCPAGEAIRAIDGDGAVTCDAFVTGITAGTGIITSGASNVTVGVNTTAIQARVSGACPSGQAIRAITSTGAVTCQPLVAAVNRTVAQVGESIPAGTSNSSVEAACPDGRLVISGACNPEMSGVIIINQFPSLSQNAWRCGFHNTTGVARNVFVYAVCMLP